MKTITDAQLAELKRMLEASTPGTWAAARGFGAFYVQGKRDDVCKLPFNYENCEENAAFIAAAHNLLPALLERLLELEQAVHLAASFFGSFSETSQLAQEIPLLWQSFMFWSKQLNDLFEGKEMTAKFDEPETYMPGKERSET